MTVLTDTDNSESGLRTVLRRFVEEEHYRDLAAMRQGQPVERIVWTGTAREFGDHIVKLHANNLIDARSQLEALTKAAAHYVLKNGKSLNPRSIYQSLTNRQTLEGKPSAIPIGKPRTQR